VGEEFNTITMKAPFQLADLCIQDFDLVEKCFSGGNVFLPLDTLTILFERPDPDADIRHGVLGPYPYGKILILNPQNNKITTIQVMDTGQVSVQ